MVKSTFLNTLISFLLVCGSQSGVAQTQAKPPFWNDVQRFKAIDSIVMPPPGKILMIGSSSFTRWPDVSRYLPGYPFINRGFGGSSLTDLIRYFDDVVAPYKPRQVLIYCGENDIRPGIVADTIVERFKTLFSMIRKQNKSAVITYISMKPSPSRAQYMPIMNEGNNKIKEWLSTQKRTSFIDVYHKMLLPDGSPMPDIFVNDQLHMNEKGYWIWANEIAPYLLKN